jgi:hypothetical protein
MSETNLNGQGVVIGRLNNKLVFYRSRKLDERIANSDSISNESQQSQVRRLNVFIISKALTIKCYSYRSI